MKKLCIDARMINHSGIGTYIRNILARWPDSNYQISVLIHPLLAAQYPFLKRFHLIETEVPIYSIKEQLGFPFLIPSCDLFWSMHYNIPLAPIRAKKRVVTMHDVNHLVHTSYLTLPQIMYAKLMLQQAARRSERIITISHFSSREIQGYLHVPKNKIVPIHLGVDRTHFSPSQDQQVLEKVRDTYQLPDKFILFVSNLAPHKNVRGLLIAWQKICDQLPEWKLVMVGKPSKQNNWNDVSKKNVIFLGQVDYQHLPLLYESAYASILPSFYEGFGLTPLESISCGCPVIVSNRASLPEVFETDSLYVDPHNPDDIAETLLKIIQDPALRDQLAISGLQRAIRFNWDKTALAHREAIEALL